MRIKIFKRLLFVLFAAAFLYSCVDEPTIEPVKYPYSSIRVGNFTTNEDIINVKVDDKSLGDISKGNIVDYFDVISGQRRFLVTDKDGNVLYDKKITIGAYAEQSLGFCGYYSSDINLTSFDVGQYDEGVVYLLDNQPSPDSSWVYVINMIGFAPTSPANLTNFNFTLTSDSSSADTTVTTASAASYTDKNSWNLLSGHYKLYTESEDVAEIAPGDTSTVKDSTEFDMNSGLRYYVWVYGEPFDIKFKVEELTALPVRDK